MRCRELFIEDIVEFYLARPCIEVQKLQEVMAALVDLFVNMVGGPALTTPKNSLPHPLGYSFLL